MTMLATTRLDVRAGARALVTALDWRVQRGEFWCVLGRNGAGKSSLLQVLAGLVPAAAGRVSLMGRPLAAIDPLSLARLRGLMMQQVSDSFSCTVFDAVAIGRTPWRIGSSLDDADDAARVHDALREVGMLARAADDVRCLSGGERQRVALAALLAQDVPLMLLDEPTSHQDIAQQLSVMRLLRERAATHAVVATCHDIHLAARFATHVLLLGDGFHQAGPVEALLTASSLERVYGCTFVAQGDSWVPVPANIAGF